MFIKTVRNSVFIFACCISLTAMADLIVPIHLIPAKSAEKTKAPEKNIGTITFKESLYGLMIKPNLHDLPPGMHGMHIHAISSCEHSGQGAGAHHDPSHSEKHLGPYDSAGHLGDLPVLYVDQTGVAHHPILAPHLKEKDLYGHSIIIHAGGDNYFDHPKLLGGGGDRIACGVIKSR